MLLWQFDVEHSKQPSPDPETGYERHDSFINLVSPSGFVYSLPLNL